METTRRWKKSNPDRVHAHSKKASLQNIYGLTVKDSDGVDLLLGNGAGREDAVTEYIAEASCAGVAHSKLTIGITAAGSAKKGTVYIYVR